MILSVVTLSGQMTDYTEQNASRVITSSQERTTSDTVSAYVAANVAGGVSPALAKQVTSDAKDLSNQQKLMTANASQLSKVSTVSTDTVSREDMTEYTVTEGDTVSSIAQKFNITTRTLRWANDLTEQETVEAGDTLTILPVDGVLHTVESDDTPQKLADRYKSNARQIVSINDAEVDGLPEGEDIIVPDGVLPESERPEYSPPQVNSYIARNFNNYTASYAPQNSSGNMTFVRNGMGMSSGGDNRHFGGQCTWYVAERKNIYDETWGNALEWAASARDRGIPVGKEPRVGAIAVRYDLNYLGHVGIVEEKLDNGKIRVRSMNLQGPWSIHDEVVEASAYSDYIYY
jgi:surface antigen/plastocyanin